MAEFGISCQRDPTFEGIQHTVMMQSFSFPHDWTARVLSEADTEYVMDNSAILGIVN